MPSRTDKKKILREMK
ncbi:hypothetical protein Gpo141_00014310, partial [Globisporangium polare]